MKKTILVTGATGYVGSNLIKTLIEENEVHILIRDSSKCDLIEECKHRINIHKYNGNIKELDTVFGQVKPYMIVHLASCFIARHQAEDIEGLINSNIVLGTQLLEMSKRYNVKYFINTGTYWQNYLGQEFNPVNLYAATKQAFEDIAKFYVETSSLRMITLRLTDTYGPNDSRAKILNLIKKIAKTNQSIDMSPGGQEMGFVYIDDVVKAFKKAMCEIVNLKAGTTKVYIVRPYKINTLKEVIQIYERLQNKKLNIRWGQRPYREREMMKIESTLANILEENEMTSIEQGIKQMCDIERAYEEKECK